MFTNVVAGVWGRWGWLVGAVLCCGCQGTVVVGTFDVDAGTSSPAIAGQGGAGAPAAGSGGGGAPAEVDTGSDAESGSGADASADVDASPPGPLAPVGPETVQIEAGTHAAFCAGRGPPLRTERPQANADCSVRLTRALFSYALCACDTLRLTAAAFRADSFDSSRSAYRPGETGAAIGVNGTFSQLTNDAQLLGSVYAVSAIPAAIEGARFTVAGDLKTNAALAPALAGSRVGRDLWIAADVLTPAGTFTVDRAAYQAKGFTGIDGVTAMRGVYPASDFELQQPCPCGAMAPLDVPALVASARASNDNAATGFVPNELSATDGLLAVEKFLPCGRLFVSDITVQMLSTVVIKTAGRTALFVDGDVTVADATTVAISAGTGELDLFIRGNLSVGSSTFGLGDADRPSAMRVYVGGEVRLGGSMPINAHVYAPNATIELAVPDFLGAQVFGSIFARNITVPTPQAVHYDRAILNLGEECRAPAPQRCDGCNQCPGDLACVAGRCAACAQDSDCCAPSVCSNGTCQPLVSSWP